MEQKRLNATVEHSVGKGKVVSSILTGSTNQIKYLRAVEEAGF